ncbi:MAG: hypothetical protein GEU98_08160 [Pseudonocardiaceae bacterium]|nr:hypothetical protein [Pseudonocardiaceae bacterium]
MQTWAKRGIQTALVTGGLLMLGTGIASADENVNPDRPASPLDGSLNIPVHADNNAIGTPGGQVDLPAVNKDIKVSPKEVTDKLPAPVKEATEPATGAADQVGAAGADAASQVTEKAAPATEPVGSATEQAGKQVEQASPQAGKAVRGAGEHLAKADKAGAAPTSNQISGDLVAPIEISGNALALGGNAEVENDASQSTSTQTPVNTDGSGTALGGNAVDLDWAAPIQVTGNAVGLFGNASSTNHVRQSAGAGGDIGTSGQGGVLAGNTLAGQLATPAQLTGNAVSGAGNAETNSEVDSEANSGGSIEGNGDGGVLSGTVGALPAAVPVEMNGSALGAFGEAEANSNSSATAGAGGTKPGVNDVPSYIQTSGDGGLGSGTVLQGPLSGPAVFSGTAGSLFGEAEATGSTANDTTAGGFDSSSGVQGVGSGSIFNAPVAMPVEAITHAVAVGGEAEALHDNEVNSLAGDGSFTNGNDSALSGTSMATPVTGPADLLGNAVGVLGKADTTGGGARDAGTGMHNEASAVAGGYNGTLGNNSLGSGNAGTVPVAMPVEGFADSVGALGTADAAATEHKVSESGGDTSTVDDNALLASNAVQAPVVAPAQVFGDTAGAIAKTTAQGDAQNEVSAGGDSKGSGVGGGASGNIVQAPMTVPAQLFGVGGSALSHTQASGTNDTITNSGGDAVTDGTEGNISGNVVSAPAGALAQAFGDQVTALGAGSATGDNLGDHTTGGDVQTAGDGGHVSGNAVTPQALPAAQLFGNAVDAAGFGAGAGTNDVVNTVGGDVSSSGDAGSLSGNLFDVPAAAVVDGFGNAASVLGNAVGAGDNTEVNSVGGNAVSDGGFAGQLPLGAVVQPYQIPLPILAEALAIGSNHSSTTVGNSEPQLNTEFNGKELPANELPSLPVRSMVPGGTPVAPMPQNLPNVQLPELPADGLTGHHLPAPKPAPKAEAPRTLSASGNDPAMASVGSGGPLGFDHMMDDLHGKPYHIQ